jgi:Tfp pilus assembly protein PilZ
MDERRSETRKKLMAFNLVYDERGKILGYLGNITEGGAMVIGEKSLEVNSLLTLNITFPEELPGGARKLTVAARVARCVPDRESSREFDIGFEFKDITPKQEAVIHSLLERFHFRYRD